MSGNGKDQIPEVLLPSNGANAPPHSWTGIFIGLTVLAAVAVVVCLQILQFLQSRPLDLGDSTEAMARYIEELLTANRVPESAITREPPLPQQSEDATWNRHQFHVTVPPSMSAQGLEGLLRNDMSRRNIAVSEAAAPDGAWRELRLSLAEHEFAAVRFMGGAERVDLSDQTVELAGRVRSFLSRTAGVDSVVPISTDRRGEGGAAWVVTTLEVRLDDQTAVESTLEPLREHLNRDDTAVSGPQRTASGATAAVSLHGRDCVLLDFAAGPAAPLEDPLPFVRLPEPSVEGEVDESPEYAEPPPPLEESPIDGDTAVAPAAVAPAPREGPARIAIIVDDAGYGGPTTDAVLALDPMLTIAVLPHAPASAETARRAAELGFEVLLHMPMDSGNSAGAFPGSIDGHMTREEIAAATESALEQTPGAVGVNNHAGSKFTTNEAALRAFFGILKEKSLFFVDSRTTADTKGVEVGAAMGLPVIERNVFLDNRQDADYIRGQFEALFDVARKHGYAVGICHFREVSVAVLGEMLPKIKNDNEFALTHVSELLP